MTILLNINCSLHTLTELILHAEKYRVYLSFGGIYFVDSPPWQDHLFGQHDAHVSLALLGSIFDGSFHFFLFPLNVWKGMDWLYITLHGYRRRYAWSIWFTVHTKKRISDAFQRIKNTSSYNKCSEAHLEFVCQAFAFPSSFCQTIHLSVKGGIF